MSRSLTAAVDAALSAEHVPYLVFVQLEFASGIVRLCNAGYDFQWNGFTWLGAGNVASIQPIQEGAELQMYGVAMQLSGVNVGLVASALGEQYQGLPAKIWVAPLGGRALKFNGINQTVSIPHIAALKPSAQISIEARIQPNGGASFDEIYRKEETERHLFRVSSFGLVVGGVYSELLSGIDFSSYIGSPHHLVGTYDGSTKNIYSDGVLIAAQPLSGAIGTAGTSLAYVGSSAGASEFFNGVIDEVRVYSRALGAAEVADHSRGYFADNTGLVGYWPFDDGQGTVATDESGNANHGTLVNSPTWVDGLTGRQRILTNPVGPFQFRMDTMAVEMGDTATITLTAESPMAAWDRPRTRRYTSEDQAQLYPADKFFEFVPAVQSMEILF